MADDIALIAAAAGAFREADEELEGVLAAETLGRRVYLCSFSSGAARSWLALDEKGKPIGDLRLVREAASIAALCEVAAESAGGGDLDELRTRLAELRQTEAPPGIEEAEAAAASLAETLGTEPRVASSAYLDAVGAAARRLEQALGNDGGASPFAASLQSALGAVEALVADVERNHKVPWE